MAIIKPEQLSSGSYNISGSFSGSFVGDGSNLTNLPSQSFNTGSFVTTSSFNAFTGSYNTGSFTGSFIGNGSGLTNLPTQSFNTSSLATTGSNTFVGNQIVTGSVTSTTGFTGSLFGTASIANTASYVQTAQTASYILNAISASYARTASYIVNAQTASYVSNAISSSYSVTASYAITALSASYAPSTPAFPFTGSALITGSLGVTGSTSFMVTGSGIVSPFIFTGGGTATSPYVKVVNSDAISEVSLIATRLAGNSVVSTAVNRAFLYLSNAAGYHNVIGSNDGLAFNASSTAGYDPATDQMRLKSGNLGIGTGYSATARLDVKTPGALSTDLAFRVRNSADTLNNFAIDGKGHINARANNNTQLYFGGSNTDNADPSYYSVVVVGYSNSNSGYRSTIVGSENSINATAKNTILGHQNTNVGDNAISIGHNNSNQNGIIIGRTNDVKGLYTPYVFGDNNTVSTQNGYPTKASYVIGSNINLPNDIKVNNSMFFGTRDVTGSAHAVLNHDNFMISSMSPTFASFDTSSRGVFYTQNGVAPTTLPTNSIAIYSADVNGVNGTASPYFRTEDGSIIWLGTQSRLFNVTASSITSSFTGSLLGTASYANNALSASYAPSLPAFPYTGSALITGSLGVTGSLSVLDSNGYNSLNTSTYILKGATGHTAINWDATTIYDGFSIESVNARSRILKDAATSGSINWAARALYDVNGSKSIMWGDRYVFDGSQKSSIAWGKRELYDGSETLALTWKDRLLVDSSTSNSIDWATRAAYDNTGRITIDWDGKKLITGGVEVVDWRNNFLNDASFLLSVDWQSRYLSDTSGNNIIDWEAKQLADSTGTGRFLWDYTNNNQKITQYGFKEERISVVEQSNLSQAASDLGLVNAAGEILLVNTNIDLAVAVGDLVSLGEDGIWYQTDQASSSGSAMLGICLNGYNKGQIFTEGTITVVTGSGYTDIPFVEGTSFYGKPVYMSDTVLGGLTTTLPTSGYVRVVGHLYYNNPSVTDYWLMKFRPSNDWYII